MESRPPLAGFALLRTMADNWWLVLLRGLAAIAFGILAFAWPVITLLTLTLLWGAYAVADGLFALWGAVAGPRGQMGARFWLVIVGIAGVIAGLLAFAWPGVTALVLLFLIAVWAIVRRDSVAQGNGRRVAADFERPAFGCLRHSLAGAARAWRAGGGLDDRLVRHPRRLPAGCAFTSLEEAQTFRVIARLGNAPI
jgi:hypothetical protein